MNPKMLFLLIFAMTFFYACDSDDESDDIINEDPDETETLIRDITDYYPEAVFGNVYRGWDQIGSYTRNEVVAYTNESGETHYYEVVEIPGGDVEWLCAAYLAQLSGGYLVCPETEDENEFVFSLIDEEVEWYVWPETNVTNGPPIGGFQEYSEEDEEDPAAGWMWLSGQSMDYTNWCQNLDDGLLDDDPRDNTQPNDVTGGNQDAMCYGEITAPVSYWGDFPSRFGDLMTGDAATFYAFIIEYESNPDDSGDK